MLCALRHAAVELTHLGGEALLSELRHRGRCVERLGHFSFALYMIDVDVLGELLSADVTSLDFHALFEHFYVELEKERERKMGLVYRLTGFFKVYRLF